MTNNENQYKRLGKIKRIKSDQPLLFEIGVTNKLMPKVIFIKGKTWVMPSIDAEENTRLETLINHSLKKISSEFINELSDVLSNDYIIDIDFLCNKIQKGKPKFFAVKLYVKQKNEVMPFEIIYKKCLKSNISLLSYKIEELFTKYGFILEKTKKACKQQASI